MVSKYRKYRKEYKMRRVVTLKAPQPAGHYSQAIIHNGIVYVSGQLPIAPETGQKILGSIEEQTQQVLKNISAILDAADSNLNRVLKTTVYVADITLWDKVNEVYSNFFGNHRPARCVVPTKELHFGFKIEMDAIAAVNEPA
jgi:2-iminobutanoate/2-iminopropanoate deaminase